MISGIYAIIDLEITAGDIGAVAKGIIEGGASVIQLRAKGVSTKDFLKAGDRIKQMCDAKVPFIVNDRADIAAALDSEGIHVGQNDMPVDIARKIVGEDKIVGLSVHSVEEAKDAVRMAPDYIGLGPVFFTTTKSDVSPLGVELIRKVKKEVDLPIVAIGGINEKNVSEVIEAGADAAAVCSAIVCAENVRSAVEKLLSKLEKK